MTERLASILLLALTFAAFAAALWLYRANRARPTLQALMHPLVTGPLMVSAILVATHIDYDQYREANQLFFFCWVPQPLRWPSRCTSNFIILVDCSGR